MLPFDKLKDAIPQSILDRGLTVLGTESKPIKLLFEQRRIPEEGWKDSQIEALLNLLSTMDSDKDSKAAHVGEREGREPGENQAHGRFSDDLKVGFWISPWGWKVR